MSRGAIAAAAAGAGVGLAALAVVHGLVLAASGAYMLAVAPLLGLPVAMGVHRALRRACTTGGSGPEIRASAGIVCLAAMAVVGISFGGYPLILPTLFLAIAAVLTPRARPAAGG